MTRKLFVSALALSVCGMPAALFADAQADAKKAVETWLGAHDRGDYAQTWETSADFVKAKVPKQQWEKTMQSVLAPFGKLESRTLVSATPMKELAGMPDGDYVLFQYQAQFANKKNAVETIIPMLENGRWKVMTYRVR